MFYCYFPVSITCSLVSSMGFSLTAINFVASTPFDKVAVTITVTTFSTLPFLAFRARNRLRLYRRYHFDYRRMRRRIEGRVRRDILSTAGISCPPLLLVEEPSTLPHFYRMPRA
jgi:hypothetical protein